MKKTTLILPINDLVNDCIDQVVGLYHKEISYVDGKILIDFKQKWMTDSVMSLFETFVENFLGEYDNVIVIGIPISNKNDWIWGSSDICIAKDIRKLLSRINKSLKKYSKTNGLFFFSGWINSPNAIYQLIPRSSTTTYERSRDDFYFSMVNIETPSKSEETRLKTFIENRLILK